MDVTYYDFSDNANGRIFTLGLGGSTTNTVESCINQCISHGFKIAGTEYSGKQEKSIIEMNND